MSNKLFSNLRKKLTLQYSLVFGVIILAIVFASYAFTWWSILAIEKQELHAKAIHEGEEWVSSKEAPVNNKEMANGDMLAYFVEPDGKTVIINQMGNAEIGKTLMKERENWPSLHDNKTIMLTIYNEKGTEHYRYLATVCEVKDNDKVVGYLYMFENMQTYFTAGVKTLENLFMVFILLFGLACFGSYWLAGRNLKPISEAYDNQKQFTADASHEMRTPLAVMKLGVQGIGSDEGSNLSNFSMNTLSMLEQEVDRLTRLTETLMTLARGDNDTYTVEHTQILLSDLAVRVANQLQFVAGEKDIAIHRRIETNITYLGDEIGINRLLIILLDNAIKYSPNTSDILLEVKRNKGSILLRVLDQGKGISSEEKTKIFDRFYRVDKARSRSIGGLGLGLALAKSIVEHHHGKIWVENNKPTGSIFTVQLPDKH